MVVVINGGDVFVGKSFPAVQNTNLRRAQTNEPICRSHPNAVLAVFHFHYRDPRREIREMHHTVY